MFIVTTAEAVPTTAATAEHYTVTHLSPSFEYRQLLHGGRTLAVYWRCIAAVLQFCE